MLTVFHKLINRLPASHRFYSLLVNVLHSENAVVLANLVGKVGAMLEAMLGQQHSDGSYVSVVICLKMMWLLILFCFVLLM